MTSQEISVKAFLLKEEGEKSEIRRFSLDPNVATSFLYLKEKLRATFPPLTLANSFEISWKDSEGDNIIICSDEELVIALTESKTEDVFRIYIRNNGQPAGNDNSPPRGPQHDGIFCDGCDGAISGYRYKCLGCHNFDLCAACEGKGVHGEHFILRIPSPMNLRHHFGHRLINKISKAARKAESRCPWSHRSGPNNYWYENLAEDFTNNCSTEEPRRHSSFRRPSRSNVEEPSDKQSTSGSCADPKECGKACGASASASASAPGAGAAASIKIDPSAIFNTLADFGIDLSVFFPPAQTSSTNENTNKQATNQPQASTPNVDTNESRAAKIPRMTANENNSSTQTPTSPSASSTSNLPSAPTAIATSPVSSPQQDRSKQRPSLLEGWTVYNPNENRNDTVTSPLQTTEINLDEEMASSRASVASDRSNTSRNVTSSSTERLYPSLEQQPKNKKVADAIDQMLAMGFKNDDGWLTNLLNLQDGNIEKVLDLIQPALNKTKK